MTSKKTAPPSGKPDIESARTDEPTVVRGDEGGDAADASHAAEARADLGEGGGMLLSTRHRRQVPAGALIIVSRQPGLRRAKIAHPAVKVYEADHFTEEDLQQILAEPLLEVIGVY